MPVHFWHENRVWKSNLLFFIFVEEIRAMVGLLFLFSETVAFWHESTRSLSVFNEILNAFIFNVLGVIKENKFVCGLFCGLRSGFSKGDFILGCSRCFFERRDLDIKVEPGLLSGGLSEPHLGDTKLLNFWFVERLVFSQVILTRSRSGIMNVLKRVIQWIFNSGSLHVLVAIKLVDCAVFHRRHNGRFYCLLFTISWGDNKVFGLFIFQKWRLAGKVDILCLGFARSESCQIRVWTWLGEHSVKIVNVRSLYCWGLICCLHRSQTLIAERFITKSFKL